MTIQNPPLFPSKIRISMDFIMAQTAQGGKELIATQPLAHAPRLVMDVLTLFIFATLTVWVEGKIRLLCFAILLVFTLALGGCIPQPSAALEALRSFQWSF